MSAAGTPDAGMVDAAGLRLGIAVTRWHAHVTDTLASRAVEAASSCGVDEPELVRVAGAMELPVVTQRLARELDAVVCLGTVVRGDTPHFGYVCEAVTAGLGRVALDEETPVGNGVLTCDSLAQAEDRCGRAGSSGDKGWEATVAALDTALTLCRLPQTRHR